MVRPLRVGEDSLDEGVGVWCLQSRAQPREGALEPRTDGGCAEAPSSGRGHLQFAKPTRKLKRWLNMQCEGPGWEKGRRVREVRGRWT